MGEIWRTSDTHFGHQKVSDIRGFRDTNAHDSAVFESIADLVKPSDTLIHFGDVSIEGTWQLGLDYMRALPCTLVLVVGNHDRIFANERTRAKYWPEYASVFTGGIYQHTRERLSGRSFVQQHFPYWPNDRNEPRYEQFRVPNLGLPIVHGHTHADEVHEFPNHFHVGWDAWKRPVAQNELIEWLETLPEIREVR